MRKLFFFFILFTGFSVLYSMKRSASLDEICRLEAEYYVYEKVLHDILVKIVVTRDMKKNFSQEIAFRYIAQDLNFFCSRFYVGPRFPPEFYDFFKLEVMSLKLSNNEIKALRLASFGTENDMRFYVNTYFLCEKYLSNGFGLK